MAKKNLQKGKAKMFDTIYRQLGLMHVKNTPVLCRPRTTDLVLHQALRCASFSEVRTMRHYLPLCYLAYATKRKWAYASLRRKHPVPGIYLN